MVPPYYVFLNFNSDLEILKGVYSFKPLILLYKICPILQFFLYWSGTLLFDGKRAAPLLYRTLFVGRPQTFI